MGLCRRILPVQMHETPSAAVDLAAQDDLIRFLKAIPDGLNHRGFRQCAVPEITDRIGSVSRRGRFIPTGCPLAPLELSADEASQLQSLAGSKDLAVFGRSAGVDGGGLRCW